jgi:hypothetical protein
MSQKARNHRHIFAIRVHKLYNLRLFVSLKNPHKARNLRHVLALRVRRVYNIWLSVSMMNALEGT